MPDGYRFAAWGAFPAELLSTLTHDLLEPVATHPLRAELRPLLLAAYGDLRHVCWGANGECLSRWGRQVLAFVPPEHRPAADRWHPTHTDRLRRLTRALALLHAWCPLQPAPTADAPVDAPALEFRGGAVPLHCREACDLVWGDVCERIADHASARCTAEGTVYIISVATGAPVPCRIPLGGVLGPMSPTYGLEEPEALADATQACVVAVPAEAIAAAVLEDKTSSLDQMPQRLADLVAGRPLG